MKRCLYVVAALLFLGIDGARAQLPNQTLTLYSDMCLNPDSGDAHGLRIGFLRLRGGIYVFYQEAAGGLLPPQIIPLPDGQLDKTLSVNFPVTEFSGKVVTFDALVTPKAIDGNIVGEAFNDLGKQGEQTHLPRLNDPQAGLPDCK